MSWFKPKLSVKQKISLSRFLVKKTLPFFTYPVYRLIPIELSAVKTIAVSHRMLLFYNPEYIQKHDISWLAADFVHEIGHILRNHHQRFLTLSVPYKNRILANRCMDAELNDGHTPLLPIGHDAVFPHTLTPPQPPHKLWEWYYRACQHHPQNHPGGLAQGECGSCAGYPAPGEPLDTEHKGRSDIELRHIRKKTAEAILAHKKAGSVPGDWLMWAQQELLPAKVRWQELLPRLLRTVTQHVSGQTDYLYNRPSRRQSALGFGAGIPVLPRIAAPELDIMFIDDSSASMSQKEHRAGLSEVWAILKNTGFNVTFGACDAKMQTLQKISSIEEAFSLVKGGGGTNFYPIFDALKKTKPRPNILIISTDGHGAAPLKPPLGTQVIWLLLGKYAKKPSFGAKEITWGYYLSIDV